MEEVKHYVILVDGNVREIQEVPEMPTRIVVTPQFSAQYLGDDGAWQIPCHKFKQIKQVHTRTRSAYYYQRMED